MKRKIFLTSGCLFAALFFQPAFCQVRLPQLISNGMVLQRNAAISVWGWASPGEKIKIHFNHHAYTTITRSDSGWKVLLLPMAAGGPYSMDIDGTSHVEIRDILIGEVWVCSGQSNMALPMQRVEEKYPEIISGSENKFIRQFFIPTTYDFNHPRADLPRSRWVSADPQSVLQFSATAYFFARKLYERFHVPIGLINSSVGGSPVEAWMSQSALQDFPEYERQAGQVRNGDYVDSIRKAESLRDNNWYHQLWLNDRGMQGKIKWYDTSYDASAWPVMEVPGFWSDAGLHAHGVVWFRKEFQLPAQMAGRPCKLYLGRIVDQDSVYLNGIFIGTVGYQYPPRIYAVPQKILRAGKNILTVRMINSAGEGGFIKDKPYRLVSDKGSIDLRGPWQYQLGATAASLPQQTFFQYKPEGLFNSMIAPLLPFTIQGVIWYQGESNAGRPDDYHALFSTMIKDWRAKWKQGDFPFLFVQLPGFGPPRTEPGESSWAEMREQQAKTLSLPHTGMAVTIDIGEWNDVHPLDKEDVGNRLALLAERIAYGDTSLVSSGPRYQSVKTVRDSLVVTFSGTGSGLISKDGPLQQFAIAGPDRKFIRASARIEGNTVIVWNEAIAHPSGVSYAWADYPQGANLYNKEGLPAAPFKMFNKK